MNYHDKAPQFSSNINGSGLVGWTYAQNRRLYGVSANFPLGDWAIGTELSYRPRDAVALNSSVDGCAGNGGNCWVDEKRYQWHLTGIYSQTQSNSKPILDFLGADTGTFMGELVLIRYPGLKSSYNGELVSAGATTGASSIRPAPRRSRPARATPRASAWTTAGCTTAS
jgi:hypothetical protein